MKPWVATSIVMVALCGMCTCIFPFGGLFAEVWRPLTRPPTVPGPETPGLARKAIGGFVVGIGAGQIALLRRTGAKLEPYRREGYAYTWCGPLSDGSVFLVEGLDDETHNLTRMWPDGRRKVLAHRKGDPNWGTFSRHPIGRHCALSPDGKTVAIGWENAHRQLPGALYEEGTIALVDIASGKIRVVAGKFLDTEISWFPDGKRVAATIVDPYDRLRVVAIDVDTGKQIIICPGSDPLVSNTGESLLVFYKGAYMSFDLASRERCTLTDCDRPIAWIDDRYAVGLALPTEGRAEGYTKSNSFLSGPKALSSLKVFDSRSPGAFETILDGQDPRDTPSYGAVQR